MRGMAEATLAERLAAHGLDEFNDETQTRAVERFAGSATSLRRHLAKSLPELITRQRAERLKESEKRMGELARQLERRRGGMSVRRLMDSYGELITAIMPCVLVSPDSVGPVLPAAAGLFDIVVFDEASQIRVADAIGAMGRGRSVVVVGDSKQMPPTSFAEVVAATPTRTRSRSRSPSRTRSPSSPSASGAGAARWLSWHYRSQDESLIAFSNRHYYDGKLSSFPAPRPGRRPWTARPRRSPWCGSTAFHRSGAAKTAAHQPGRGAAPWSTRSAAGSPPRRRPCPSIGVVTFNASSAT